MGLWVVPTVLYVFCSWCLCCDSSRVGFMEGFSVAAGAGRGIGAGGGSTPLCLSGAGVCPAPLMWLWPPCPGFLFSSCQSAVAYCLFCCSWGCCVLCVALFAPLCCASGDSCCLRLVWALLVCFYSVLLVRARAPAFCLGVFLWGFPAVFCAATPVPTIASLCTRHFLPSRTAHS